MDDITRLTAKHPKLTAWVAVHGAGLMDALDMRTTDSTLAALLLKIRDTRWTGFKDDMDRAANHVLTAYLRGGDADEEVRMAVHLLTHKFNQACEEIFYLKRRPRPTPRFPMR